MGVSCCMEFNFNTSSCTRTHTHAHFCTLSIVAVGGDGLFNEVLNGLLIQTQNQSGVNLRRSRFVPVTPTIRLGVIPTGFNNSICRSVFGCKSPMVAAAQIMLGEEGEGVRG